ncbi:cyclic-di-AMP-binding protein CbpB [uncultured Trichococcus sp.]|uniref:cyclic-di-AMP-binding protein CbpB n=1 Tax=uncultured Trichococcus sp. TaxID=189665 RepID=UPI0029C794BD|nr:cyclic-di-AMP-binding protein CbpB [uncultured Trichococcus sp.]
MISSEVAGLLLDNDACGDLMILGENVANVHCSNNLNHAFLVLSQVKYSVIPVLDSKSRIKGLISMPMIIQAITEIDAIRYDKLETIRVEEVMDRDVQTIRPWTDLEDILNYLIDHNFLCVTEDDGKFIGIITRKEILTRVNHLVHGIHRIYKLEKIEEKEEVASKR